MKVLLKQNIDRVGRMGEIVEVAGGYARNFLIPRGLAVGVTRGGVKEIAEQKRVLDVKAERQREQVQGLGEKIISMPVVIKARCSATGKLFGSITNRQVAEAIAEAGGEEVDRHKIHVDDRIRSVGTYTALIKLHPDVEIAKEFEVAGEGFEAEEPPEEEGDVAAVEAAAVEMEVTVETVTAFEPEPEPEPGADMADEAAGETEEQPEQG